MHRTHAGHGSIWPAETSGKPAEARASDQSTLTAERIAELRALLAKATPGPWKNHLVDDTTIVASNGFEIGTTWPGGSVYNGFVDPAEQHEINAALIVAMRNALPALLDAAERLERQVRAKQQEIEEIAARAQENYERALAAERLASRAREEALREAIEICKEADAQDDRDNGAAATGAACNAANAILALINKPKGGDVNAAVESRYGDATSPGVTAGASAGEDGELCKRVDDTLQAMASQAFVPMGLWDKHSNGVLALIARIRTLSAQLAEAEKYNGWHQEALLVRDAALERAEKAEGERDNARAECSWLAKRLLHERSLLSSIAQDVEDEGGRVYFGRTNDADALKDFVDEIENYDFDRITRESKWPDYIETSRLAHERAAAAERERDELRAEVERLREKVERLTKALEPFAKAASDYERKGEFFSNNVELVLRVSVFAAPEYHNSTAVQVGDLRRARSELESGHE